MLKEYMSKLPFLQTSQSKNRRTRQPPSAESAPQEEESLWPEGDPFAEEETPPAAPAQPDPFTAGAEAYRAGDYAAALSLFLQSAGQGHAESQFLCGQLYRRGLGAEVNDRQALTWYKRAAKQGHMNSQLACASIYEEGRGTEMDLKRALSWYELAAKQGDVGAQLKCGRMYHSGRAETRNPKKARYWLEIAAGNGSEEASRMLSDRF